MSIRSSQAALILLAILLAACERAPSVDILGSFFPIWIFCIAAGVIVAVVARQVLVRLEFDTYFGPAILIYPSMAALIAFVTWLIFFR